MIELAEREFGGLDIVVNNAGFTADAWITTRTDEAWSGVLEVLLTGPFQVCRAAARLPRVPCGSAPFHHRKVVNTASVNGLYGAAGQVNYSAAEAGLVGRPVASRLRGMRAVRFPDPGDPSVLRAEEVAEPRASRR